MSKIRNAFCFSLLIFIAACSDDEQDLSKNVTFEPFGLENRIVHRLRLLDDKLYAATDDGIYTRVLTVSNDWEAIGLQGQEVTAMDINGNIIIAAINNYAEEDFRLYKSENGGAEWLQVENDFGGQYSEPVKDLKFHPSENKIFGTGYNVIAESGDMGESWEAVHGSWGAIATGLSFVDVHPSKEEIWAGGQNSIEELVLYKINAADTIFWRTLLPSPSVAKKVAFHPFNDAEVIVGAEGGIIKTTNGGDTWITIKENHDDARFFFGVIYDPVNPDIIYAAGWLKNFNDPQPTILFISQNKGESWSAYEHPDDHLFGGVYDMVLAREGNEAALYLGLFKGGVYKASIE